VCRGKGPVGTQKTGREGKKTAREIFDFDPRRGGPVMHEEISEDSLFKGKEGDGVASGAQSKTENR